MRGVLFINFYWSTPMQVVVHQDRLFALLDVLLARWRASPRQYPFNRKDAVVPQSIIPPEIRNNKHTLACFYFYVCIYMRGGIKSLQAFSALISMWRQHPELFDPHQAQWWKQEDVQIVLKRFIGWDSFVASTNWVENSKRLMRNWDGNPLSLIKGLKTYEDALRRIKNKLTKRELREVRLENEGFRGYQPKMVSMFLYFCDWEGWLPKGFLYPAPVDFHNYRIALGNVVMEVIPETRTLRVSEKLSAPWRDALMEYMRKRGADPIEVADVLWLFSLVMCGNSPATTTFKTHPLKKKNLVTLFTVAGVAETWDQTQWTATKRLRLQQTCLICPLADTCEFAIPAGPYYGRRGSEHSGGILKLIPRPKVFEGVGLNHLPQNPPEETLVLNQEVLVLLAHIDDPASA